MAPYPFVDGENLSDSHLHDERHVGQALFDSYLLFAGIDDYSQPPFNAGSINTTKRKFAQRSAAHK